MKEKLKGIIKGKQFRQGSYSSVLIVIIIAIVVVINLAAGQIPSQYSQVDISDNQLYSIGDQTRTLLSDLDTDVDIYYICQEGSEDTTIQRMLNLYEDSSSHINVTQVDPVVSRRLPLNIQMRRWRTTVLLLYAERLPSISPIRICILQK